MKRVEYYIQGPGFRVLSIYPAYIELPNFIDATSLSQNLQHYLKELYFCIAMTIDTYHILMIVAPLRNALKTFQMAPQSSKYDECQHH